MQEAESEVHGEETRRQVGYEPENVKCYSC